MTSEIGFSNINVVPLRIYPSRSVSLKVPSAEGCGEASTVAFVGAASEAGWKAFQGLEGQWKGVSFTSSVIARTEAVGLGAVVSSSEDSSWAKAVEEGGGGGGGGGGEGVEAVEGGEGTL